MRFPAWLKARQQATTTGTVTFHLALNTERLETAMAALSRMGVAAESFSASMRQVQRALEGARPEMLDELRAMVRREVAREEARRAGLEARYYVRGAMDPRFTTPEARDNYVNDMLAGWDGSPWEPEGRAFRAAAFLRGWVEHHHPDPEPVPVYSGWNPVAATVACDWCGECEWCRTYPTGQ